MKWKSLHLFIHDKTFIDDFLRNYLYPSITEMKKEGLLQAYFYIIYWQGGNHVRFRYKTLHEEKVYERVYTAFDKFLTVYKPKHSMDEELYYKLYINNKENVQDITIVEDRSIIIKDYEREYERYGGFKAISYIENIFQCSSDYALEAIKLCDNNMNKRFIITLDMFSIAIKSFDDKESFIKNYRANWMGFLNFDINKIEKTDGSFYYERYKKIIKDGLNYYDKWEKCLKENMDKALKVQETFKNSTIGKVLLLASIIHMNNNRMGIVPFYEVKLTDILIDCEEALKNDNSNVGFQRKS